MKFKGIYEGANGYRIGRFYNSDIKKICSMLPRFDFALADEEAKDPEKFFAAKVANERELFFSVKKGTKVIGYGNFSLLDSTKHIVMNFWKRNLEFSFGDVMGVMRLMIEFAFKVIKARRISVIVANRRVFPILKRLGFDIEGNVKEAAFYDGEARNIYLFGLLRRAEK